MTKEQAKKWEKEIAFWVNGGNLWGYSSDGDWFKYTKEGMVFGGDIYVIEDKHFEARKAFALGEPIEVKCGVTPSWGSHCEYRPKPKEWYSKVSKENPILCWVKGKRNKTIPASIYKYEDDLFYDTDCYRWEFAEPIKPEECHHD